MEKAYASTPYGAIHYVTEGTGYPLLLIHSSPTSWQDFSEMIPFLSKNHKVIAMDSIGFGGSDKPSRKYQIKDYAESVLHFLDSIGISETDVIGSSTGASIAAELAVIAPSRVRKLVLIALAFWISDDERKTRLAEKDKPGTMAYEETTLDGSHLSDIWEHTKGRVLEGDTTEISEKDLVWMYEYSLDCLRAGTEWKSAYLAVLNYYSPSRLPLIKSPTLVVGVHGSGIAAAGGSYTNRADQASSIIPNGQALNIQGAYTRVKQTKAYELSKKIESFLENS